MAWDADSNRVSFTSSTGGTTQFVYDITAGIPAVIKEISTGDPEVYVREPDGSLIAMFRDGVYPFYYHFDALGSTRMLTDETGHITDTYTYDAWGNASHTSGTTEQPYQYVGQLGYYTHYQDANLPLLQLGVRFYDPGTGRFGQVDQIDEKRWSSYAYAVDSPLALVDPEGEKGWSEKRYGDGMVCVDSSCYSSPAFGKIGGTMKNIPDLGKPGNSQRLPNAPHPCPGKKRQQCALTDGLDIPPGTPIDFDGAPQRPRGKRTLKIPDGWTCEFRCSSSGVTLKCWVRKGLPPRFRDPKWL